MEEKTKKQYALSFILKSSINTEEADQYRAALNDKIQSLEGRVTSSVCSEAPKQLAYPIKKESRGYFCECVFESSPAKLGGIENLLKNDLRVIRYMFELKQQSTLGKRRKRRSRPEPKPLEHWKAPEKHPQEPEEKREKVNIEEIEKKLDEIIENI